MSFTTALPCPEHDHAQSWCCQANSTWQSIDSSKRSLKKTQINPKREKSPKNFPAARNVTAWRSGGLCSPQPLLCQLWIQILMLKAVQGGAATAADLIQGIFLCASAKSCVQCFERKQGRCLCPTACSGGFMATFPCCGHKLLSVCAFCPAQLTLGSAEEMIEKGFLLTHRQLVPREVGAFQGQIFL